MEEESAATEAVNNLNGHSIKGRPIKVKKSESKYPRKPSAKPGFSNNTRVVASALKTDGEVIGPKFENDERVLCCTIISPLLIEAKCQEVKMVQLNTRHYLIHYMN